MTAAQIRELKVKTFPYLSHDDVRLSMSDRNIIRKELDLGTDSVLPGNDKQSIRDFFYSMCECLSTHDNPSVKNKSYVSLKTVNLKPFYIKPYLTHETEIKFAKVEMEKNISPAYFTSLMNDLLHDLPSDIREYIDCIMDDIIIFTPDIKKQKGNQKLYAYAEEIWRAFDNQQDPYLLIQSEIYGVITVQQGQSTLYYTFGFMC